MYVSTHAVQDVCGQDHEVNNMVVISWYITSASYSQEVIICPTSVYIFEICSRWWLKNAGRFNNMQIIGQGFLKPGWCNFAFRSSTVAWAREYTYRGSYVRLLSSPSATFCYFVCFPLLTSFFNNLRLHAEETGLCDWHNWLRKRKEWKIKVSTQFSAGWGIEAFSDFLFWKAWCNFL